MTFAEKLRKLRKMRGMTTTELANAANLSQPMISQYENGVKRPHPNMKIILAMALRCKPSDLDDDVQEAPATSSANS